MNRDQENDLKPERVRVAVLFTDLVGSTQWLYDVKQDVGFSALESHFRIVKEAFAVFQGCIVKYTGDGVVAVFPTLENAIRAGVATQQDLAKARSGEDPLRIPSMRIGISAGEAYRIARAEAGTDYFGRVCAEASRILDITEGHHILVSYEALQQERFGRDALIKDGIDFTEHLRVYRKGLDEVPICEVLYRPRDEAPPQIISRSRPDIAPFSYFENSVKAESIVDDFLRECSHFDFLHIRGISPGSSSPFNRFMKLMTGGVFRQKIDSVRVGVVDPNCGWLGKYYRRERKDSPEVAERRIEVCRRSLEVTKAELERFRLEGRISQWRIFLYDSAPIWRLLITERGIIATPYGGQNRTKDSIVLSMESTEDPTYHSFRRFFDNILEKSRIYE